MRQPRLPEGACYRGAFNAPLLWNSNFFMSKSTMKLLRVLIDVWLPDLKFGPGACAVKLARTPWYWETVTNNLQLIHGWGEDFTIRHLVMPNHLDCCTRPVLAWLAATMPEVPVNIMGQYRPDHLCDPYHWKFDAKYQELARRPTPDEVRDAYGYARELGLCFEALSFESDSRYYQQV
jgi:putative pyruvate formate lyase activating enzyme